VKKIGVLNQFLSTAIAGLGHKDMLVLCDAGLPIPDGPTRIDLAVAKGLPSLLGVLEAVLQEMQVESVIMADEIKTASPEMYAALCAMLDDIPVTFMPHEAFKTRTKDARAITRTGEFTPYANVILVSGVIF
jgi:D-ribose pyranase